MFEIKETNRTMFTNDRKEAHGMAKLLSGMNPSIFPTELNDLLEAPVDPKGGK